MKYKVVTGIMLTLLFVGILTLAFNIEPVSAAVSPYIAVIPASTVDSAFTPGMNYTISIYTDYNGSDVWGYEFELTFNPNVLEGIEVVNGDLITEDVGTTMFLSAGFNNTSGELGLTGNGFFFIDPPSPVTSGPGTLANISFSVVGCGDSYINLGDRTRLIGYNVTTQEDYNIIDKYSLDQIHDGFFSNAPVPIHDIYIRADGSIDPPTANITSLDNVTYYFTDNIFNQSIFVERDNIVIDGAGYTIQGTGAPFSIGIDLTGRSNVTIKNIEVKAFGYGIRLNESSNNTISGNNITANNNIGVWLLYSYGNEISGNNITANNGEVIVLSYSSNHNSISGNNVRNNYDGIELQDSSNNTISGNNITATEYVGITLGGSSNNTISKNNITNNDVGIYFDESSNNKFYHNNFINNTLQVYDFSWDYAATPSINLWDDGYPSGGNYWSNYTDVDEKSGPNQDQLGSDGFWDTPYVIDENNQDNYPIVPEFPSFLILPLFMIATLLVVIAYRRKNSQMQKNNSMF